MYALLLCRKHHCMRGQGRLVLPLPLLQHALALRLLVLVLR